MIRATHLTEPSKCRNFIRDNYNNTSQEYIILIHILKNTLDRNCDLQLLLPDISIKKDLTDVYDNLQNSIRKNLTVHFDILRGALLIDKSDSSKIYTTINITDEIALHFLSTQPETRKHFYLLPPNVDELIEEYKSKHSKKKNNNFPVKTKGQKTANKNKSFTEPINVFSKFLQITNPDTIKSIVEIISSDLKVSKSPNLSVALFTVALQRKCYLSSVLNKTQYHKALVGLFGEKAGTRAKFNEKFNEIIQELYVTNLDEYIKRLP